MLCHSKVNKQFKGVEFPCAIKYPFNRRTAPLTFEHVSQGLTHKVHNRASITCFLTSTLFSGDGFTLGRCLLRVPFGEYMLTLSLECKIRMARPYMATIEAVWFQRTSTIIIQLRCRHDVECGFENLSSPHRTLLERVRMFQNIFCCTYVQWQPMLRLGLELMPNRRISELNHK